MPISAFPKSTSAVSSSGGLTGDTRALQQQTRPYGVFDINVAGGRGLHSGQGYGSSVENVLRKQILETHESDDRLFAVKPVLHIIEVIFHRATSDHPGSTAQVDIKPLTPLYSLLFSGHQVIHKFACQPKAQQ